MKKILNWKARRSGGRITITGQNEKGERVNITEIDTIIPKYVTERRRVGLFGMQDHVTLHVFATRSDQTQYELA